MINQMGFLSIVVILVALAILIGRRIYKTLHEEQQVQICVALLATGSLASLGLVLYMKPGVNVTVIGSLMDTSNDYLLLPVVILVVAAINLFNGNVEKKV